MNVHRASSKKIAIVAVFTALTIAMAKLLPNIPVVGLPQGQGSISPTVILYPIIGLILGPILGFLTAIIANTIVWIIPPSDDIRSTNHTRWRVCCMYLRLYR
jgi:uncharacterized membrane protein